MPAANRTLGWAILEWTADYLQQPDGPNAGESWDYTDEQVRMILRWYAIDEHGRFVYRRGVIRRMKGWGKDPLCATIAAIELCGPCRFGGWDAAKKPVAIQHPAPWIQIAAVSRDQTRNTMTLFPGLFTRPSRTTRSTSARRLSTPGGTGASRRLPRRLEPSRVVVRRSSS